jgi:hypothetical protein
MKLVIELEIGTRAVKTYRNAKKIIGDQVGLVGARHGVSLQIDIPEYGDTGLLTDAKNRTVGSWRVNVGSVLRRNLFGAFHDENVDGSFLGV